MLNDWLIQNLNPLPPFTKAGERVNFPKHGIVGGGGMELAYNDEVDWHLKVTSGEHTGISSITTKKTKLVIEISIWDHFLECKIILFLKHLSHGNQR